MILNFIYIVDLNIYFITILPSKRFRLILVVTFLIYAACQEFLAFPPRERVYLVNLARTLEKTPSLKFNIKKLLYPRKRDMTSRTRVNEKRRHYSPHPAEAGHDGRGGVTHRRRKQFRRHDVDDVEG